MIFADRIEAGRRLADKLGRYAGRQVVVLGLPRGGVPVAAQVAATLGAPLDVIVVRKLGVPSQPELAMGAIGEGDIRIIEDEVIELTHVTPDEISAVERRERVELERQARRFRDARPRVDLTGRTVLIVDDGIATGSTARAACQVARASGAKHVVVATPVAPNDIARKLSGAADELVVVANPERFSGVGQFYVDFSPTSDAEVVELLESRTP